MHTKGEKMLTEGSIEQYLKSCAALGHSPNSIRAYRADLMGLYHALDGNPEARQYRSMLEEAAAEYLTENRAEWAPKTTERKLGTIRQWARAHGWDNFLADYRAPTPARAEPHPIPEGIEGIHKMIMSSRNVRHRALVALCGLMGLRVGEAVNVRPEHFDLHEMTLKVRGKGDVERIVPVSELAWKHLERAYLDACDKGTTLTRLTNDGARKAIRRHGRNAGLSRPIASHDLRATLATAAYDKSKDLRAVQEVLGHSNPATTMRYTRVSMAAKRGAVEV